MAQTQLQPGQPAPPISLLSDEGKHVSLADYKGKWVVLYFYPKDFTSGCTLEAHNFQRDLHKFEQSGAAILGVSVDSAESHKSFCAKEGLNFKLLADTDANVSRAYGSVKDYEGTRVSARNTFIIDPVGKIARVFIGVKPQTHSEEVLQALAEINKSGMTGRKYIDCREHPSEKNCTLRISGSEDEVLDAAVQHATCAHGHENSPVLKQQIRSMLKDATE